MISMIDEEIARQVRRLQSGQYSITISDDWDTAAMEAARRDDNAVGLWVRDERLFVVRAMTTETRP